VLQANKEDNDENVSVVVCFCGDPIQRERKRMMVYVNEIELPRLLLDDHDYGIHQIENLAQIIDPLKVGHHRVGGIVGITFPEIICPETVSVSQRRRFSHHVRLENNLKYVVDEFRFG